MRSICDVEQQHYCLFADKAYAPPSASHWAPPCVSIDVFFLVIFSDVCFSSCGSIWFFKTKMKLSPWSTHQRLPRQLPGNVSPDVIAQLDFTDKTTLVPVIWAIVLLEAVVITVVVVARLIVRRVVIGRLFMDDGMAPLNPPQHDLLVED